MHSIFQQFLKNYANFCPKLCNTSEELNILFDRFFKFLNSTIHEHTVDVIGTSSLLQKNMTFTKEHKILIIRCCDRKKVTERRGLSRNFRIKMVSVVFE